MSLKPISFSDFKNLLFPTSEGGEAITDAEIRQFVANHPTQKNDLEKVLRAIQSVSSGIALDEGEIRTIETIEGGKEFLQSLATHPFSVSTYRFFASDAGEYGHTQQGLEVGLTHIQERTGLELIWKKEGLTLGPLDEKDYPLLERFIKGNFDELLHTLHDIYGLERLSLSGFLSSFQAFSWRKMNSKPEEVKKYLKFIGNAPIQDSAFLFLFEELDFDKSKFNGPQKKAYLGFLEKTGWTYDRQFYSLLAKPADAEKWFKNLTFLRTIFPNYQPWQQRDWHGFEDLHPISNLTKVQRELLTAQAENLREIIKTPEEQNRFGIWAFIKWAKLLEKDPHVLEPFTVFSRKGFDVSGLFFHEEDEISRTSQIVKENDTPANWERFDKIVAARGPLELSYPDAFTTFFSLAATDDGMKFLMEEAPKDQWAKYLEIVSIVDLDFARKTVHLGVPLQLEGDYAYYGPLRDIFEIPQGEWNNFVTQFRSQYPQFFAEGVFLEAETWLNLWNNRESLFSPTLGPYYQHFVETMHLSNEEALVILTTPSNELFTTDLSPRLEKTLESLAPLPSGNLAVWIYLFKYLPSLSNESLDFLDQLIDLGVVDDLMQVVGFIVSTVGFARTPVPKEAVLKSAPLFEGLDFEKGDFETNLAIFANWPEGFDPHPIATTLFSLTETPPSLETLFFYALHKPDRDVLFSADFKSWVSKIKETYPDLSWNSNTVSYWVALYQMGEGSRSQVLDPNFSAHWKELTNRFYPPPAAGTYKLYQFERIPREALLLSFYPLPSTWEDFDLFLKNNGYDKATMELYKMYVLMEKNPALKELYSQIKANPSFGKDVVYDTPPLKREGKENIYEERPPWETLDPIVKLKALVLKTALMEDKTLQAQIRDQLLGDIADKKTEWGGSLWWNAQNHSFTYRTGKLLPIDDGKTLDRDPVSQMGFVSFHQHALENDNSPHAGPSYVPAQWNQAGDGDLFGTQGTKTTSLVFTTAGVTDKEVFYNADLYGEDTNGSLVVVDLTGRVSLK